jgi:hypothetical protein
MVLSGAINNCGGGTILAALNSEKVEALMGMLERDFAC